MLLGLLGCVCVFVYGLPWCIRRTDPSAPRRTTVGSSSCVSSNRLPPSGRGRGRERVMGCMRVCMTRGVRECHMVSPLRGCSLSSSYKRCERVHMRMY